MKNKNENATGFADLLAYAKSDSGIHNKTYTTTNTINIEYCTGVNNNDNFEWSDFGDSTTAPSSLPDTGMKIIIWLSGLLLIGGGIYSYTQYRKNNY